MRECQEEILDEAATKQLLIFNGEANTNVDRDLNEYLFLF